MVNRTASRDQQLTAKDAQLADQCGNLTRSRHHLSFRLPSRRHGLEPTRSPPWRSLIITALQIGTSETSDRIFRSSTSPGIRSRTWSAT